MGLPFTHIAFVRGMVAGFALAAPLGPVAVLCIRRALARGRIDCIVAGTAAAAADTIFGAVAGLGITYISSFVLRHEATIGVIGGSIVLAVGILTFRTRVCPITGTVHVESLRRDMLAAFTMAITNPATMIGAAGIFAAFGAVDLKLYPGRAFWLVFGVFMGSMLWWTILAITAGTLKEKFIQGGLRRVNRIAGAIIALSGAAVLAAGIYRLAH